MNDQKQRPDLLKIGFFIELPAKRREFLASKLKRQVYPPGAEIIRAGRSGRFLGIIENGEVSLKKGAEESLTASSGGIFGSEMLLDGKPSEFTISTLTESVIWVLNRSDWQAPSTPIPRRTFYPGILRVSKATWITLIVTLAVAVAVFTLGPTLFERANNTLPSYLVDKGRPDLAENYLHFAVRLQPESALLYSNLGDILALQGKVQEAVSVYEQAITLDEYLPWIHNNLGVLLVELDQKTMAVGEFQTAIDLNPFNTSAYINLGNTYYTLEKWHEAAATYQKALELDFTLLETKAAWAGLILYDSRLVEARLVWEDVLNADPRHSLALQGLGVVSLLEEDPGVAMLYFDAARYLNPDDIAMHLYIGLALEGMDRFSEAAAEYQYVVEKGSDPELISLADSLLEVVLE